ncbi:P-loop containing nucleoside triphosphate hydrolase protein [Trametes meyenii]|nr:P-loop containing nucleoside triphosphate hydrolase protein [Trametes meyenii]
MSLFAGTAEWFSEPLQVPLISGVTNLPARNPRYAFVMSLLASILSVDSVTDVATLNGWIRHWPPRTVYFAILSILSLFGTSRVDARAFVHVSLLLAVSWCTYIYRDVWPLATVDLSPADAYSGYTLWTIFAFLTLGGVIVPLLIPRKYIPINPADSMAPGPDQTACLFSLLTYWYMMPLIKLAWRLPPLTYAMFPPLADYDHLKNLVGRAFPHLDPLQSKSRRHLALVIIRVFWFEYLSLAAMSIVAVIASFAAPISIKGLLSYFEAGGAYSHIRPWFWIVLFFFGRVVKDISDQWFMYQHTRVTIRIQAVITELVFEHALRIRMKTETSDAVDDAESVSSSHASEATGLVGEGSTTAGSSATAQDGDAQPSSVDNKGKAKDASERTAPVPKEPETRSVPEKKGGGPNIIGRINNLVTTDLRNLDQASMYATAVALEVPLQVTLCMVFLYQILGYSALVGLATMLVTLPLPGYIAKLIQGVQHEKMKRTDSRVQVVTEMVSVVRMIKLFGWESRIAAQLDQRRREELIAVRKSKMLALTVNLCHVWLMKCIRTCYVLPVLIMLSTFSTYVSGSAPSRVFSAMPVLEILRDDLQVAFNMLPQLVQSEFSPGPCLDSECFSAAAPPADRAGVVGIRNATFTWSKEATASQTPGSTRKRTFALRVDEELNFQRGKVNLIVGPTGAGKTSLLMALLSEMHYIPSGSDSYVSLPREAGIAYAAQESWVQNDTIRNNILFGAPYDEARYQKVLSQCALQPDLSLFDAGDDTEVGEKGITLRYARITLARAVYSQAEILLLDDVLAALDVHTSKWIVEKCLKGDLLRGRTIILVSHNVALVGPIADFVVDVGSDGRILSQGTLASALERDSELVKEISEKREEIEKANLEVNAEKAEAAVAKPPGGKLVIEEETEVGHVGWTALKLYIGNMSKTPLIFWFLYVSGHASQQFFGNIQIWYLGYWASQYENRAPQDVAVGHYLTVYTLFVVAGLVSIALCVTYYVFGSLRAARIVHEKLVVSVLGTTLRWLDKTPAARIITRCTEDIHTIDNQIARSTDMLVQIVLILLVKVLAIVLFSPAFIGPAILIGIAGSLIGYVFMRAQLSVKREMSKAKAPVLSHFGAAIGGIVSVRAYGAQEAFKIEAHRRIDKYSQVSVTHEGLNRWLSIYIDFVGTLFATGLAIYLTYVAKLSAADTGFSLNMAVVFGSTLFFFIRYFNDYQIAGSLERIQQYLLIEQEPKPTPAGVPPAYWPASGHLEVEKLSARYSQDGPQVLRGISFEVTAGERIGVVGRTGSGKSSLTLALLRCILTEGNVRYDGLPTDKLNLDALRSNITIIPQVPELMSGTLRQNLDPFSEHDDAVLNDALRSAGLFSLQGEEDQSRITLDTTIAGGGSNLSVGQRQILALARAIVRRSKLLILDEDYETDTVIQTSLRTELGKDVTLLTVAHRLQTIMDADKIMVLDAGRIVEFGKPSHLLKDKKGFLRALVDESGDREKLYEMARGTSSS